ncbi:MAG: hypothetical protein IJQ92_00410 [Bacilli bacterium]|nr:hypothetical protein [Bacilli bacterium]
MISFNMLSSLIRALFALWALLLCVISIANAVMAFNKKKYLFGSIAVTLFLLIYFFWQVIFDYSLSESNGSLNVVSSAMVNLGWIYWLLIFLLLTIFIVILLVYNVHYERNYLTVNTIKLYLDQVDCGICCYKDNGRVMFSNMIMNQLFIKLTGTQLLNGNQFYEVTKDQILSIGLERWRFSSRDITIGNEHMTEIIATNVTSEYLKTQQLEKDKAELSKINQELQDYNLSIDEVVRHQEILQAKVNIHDEMNRLMLSTVSTDSKDISNLDKIFALWQENALLLSMEAEENKQEAMSHKIEELAEVLKIHLLWKDEPVSVLSEEERNIFYIAAQEAIANASKHAKASRMIISITKVNEHIECHFINDGDLPDKTITFTGGLANLEKLIKKQGAILKVNYDHQFVLSLVFLNKNYPNG